MRKYLTLLVSMIYALMVLAVPVQAADTSASGSNTMMLYYYATHEGQTLTNVEFYLYLVAELGEDGSAEVTSEFADYNVDLSDIDMSDAGRLTALAGTLSAYAARDKIASFREGFTDARGDLTFSGLPNGVYLVCGESVIVKLEDGEEWRYVPQAVLIPLPYTDTEGAVHRLMEIEVKYERIPIPPVDDTVDLTVRKVWSGSEEHPASVTAQLLRDGTVSDEAVLDDSNGWQHTWEDLSSGSDWQITEKNVPDGYTVSVTQDGYDFTITNTSVPKDDPPEVPPEDPSDDPPDVPPDNPPDVPPDNPPDVPPPDTPPEGPVGDRPSIPYPPAVPIKPPADHTADDMGEPEGYDPGASLDDPEDVLEDEPLPAEPIEDHTTEPSENIDEAVPTPSVGLPQTGQLWWPVPVLWCFGLVLIMAGVFMRRSAKGSHE